MTCQEGARSHVLFKCGLLCAWSSLCGAAMASETYKFPCPCCSSRLSITIKTSMDVYLGETFETPDMGKDAAGSEGPEASTAEEQGLQPPLAILDRQEQAQPNPISEVQKKLDKTVETINRLKLLVEEGEAKEKADILAAMPKARPKGRGAEVPPWKMQ